MSIVVKYGGDEKTFPMHAATCEGDHDALKQILGDTPLGAASALLQELDQEGCTPLHYSCFLGSTTCAAMLLQAGADVNTADGVDGGTALHFAAWKGDWPELVAMLLDAGANRKAKNRCKFH